MHHTHRQTFPPVISTFPPLQKFRTIHCNPVTPIICGKLICSFTQDDLPHVLSVHRRAPTPLTLSSEQHSLICLPLSFSLLNPLCPVYLPLHRSQAPFSADGAYCGQIGLQVSLWQRRIVKSYISTSSGAMIQRLPLEMVPPTSCNK